jgi:hypothetical protein
MPNSAPLYITQYPAFLTFFGSIKAWDRQSVILGASLVYSWMPTILKRLEDAPGLAVWLRKFTEHGLTCDEPEEVLDLLKLEPPPFINSSCVGTSKFLHFYRPALFPIIDSKIAKVMWLNASRWEDYLLYFEAMHSVSNATRKRALDAATLYHGGERPTYIRACELALFLSS